MSKHIEKLKNARSIHDVLDVISDIAYEYKNSSAIIKRLTSSLSAMAPINFDGRDKTRRAAPAPTNTSVPDAKIVDSKYVAPDLNELKVHSTQLSKLYASLAGLDAAETLLKHSFLNKKEQPAALKSITALRQSIDVDEEKLFKALKVIAAKHLPPKFSRFIDSVRGELITLLPPKSYNGECKSHIYVIPSPKDESIFHFCNFIEIQDLTTSHGYKFDVYYVVITGVINKFGAMQYYINGLPDFTSLEKYPLGEHVDTVAEAKHELSKLMAYNDFVVDFERLPLHLTLADAKHAGFTNIKGVTGVDIVDDKFYAFIVEGIAAKSIRLKNITLEVQALLSSAIGDKRGDNVLQSKLVKKNSKNAIEFIATPNIGNKKAATLRKIENIRDIGDLSPDQHAALRFALQHPPKVIPLTPAQLIAREERRKLHEEKKAAKEKADAAAAKKTKVVIKP